MSCSRDELGAVGGPGEGENVGLEEGKKWVNLVRRAKKTGQAHPGTAIATPRLSRQPSSCSLVIRIPNERSHIVSSAREPPPIWRDSERIDAGVVGLKSGFVSESRGREGGIDEGRAKAGRRTGWIGQSEVGGRKGTLASAHVLLCLSLVCLRMKWRRESCFSLSSLDFSTSRSTPCV
jgi:hypothetical protein